MTKKYADWEPWEKIYEELNQAVNKMQDYDDPQEALSHDEFVAFRRSWYIMLNQVRKYEAYFTELHEREAYADLEDAGTASL
jgi:hypothetical protein